MGAAAARRLAGLGAKVVVVGRAVDRTGAVADEIGGTAFCADFSSFAEVRKLADDLLEHAPRIDILANNAGFTSARRQLTPDGHEVTMQVNYLSPFLLTALLRDALLESPAARIITTSSSLYRHGRLDLDDLGGTRGRYRQLRAYNNSKLADLAHAAELNRRLPATATATAFHPGTVRSGLDRGSRLVTVVKRYTPVRLLTNSPEEGAEPLVAIATADQADLRDVFYNRLERQHPQHPAVTDAAFGARLWQRTTEITGAPAWPRPANR
ncbi:short-chain dehydrogenase [Actinoplanes sp. NBRC 14428]|nr:short-chain dehydrogenase [Actinoplanes sp. NBRC 14428]